MNDAVQQTLDGKLYDLFTLARSIRNTATDVRDKVSGAIPESVTEGKQPTRQTVHEIINQITDTLKAADYILGNLSADFAASKSQAQTASQGA